MSTPLDLALPAAVSGSGGVPAGDDAGRASVVTGLVVAELAPLDLALVVAEHEPQHAPHTTLLSTD